MAHPGSDGAERLTRRLRDHPCCAAIVDDRQLAPALASDAPIVFVLRGNGLDLASTIRRIHDEDKLVAVHLDLVDGLRADHAGVVWLARLGADAIITSHGQLVATIRAEGAAAIQRLLLSRRGHLDQALGAIRRSRPDIVEVLPGVVLPAVRRLLGDFEPPLLAGGFVRTAEEVEAILAAGAIGVTTSTPALWSWRAEPVPV